MLMFVSTALLIKDLKEGFSADFLAGKLGITIEELKATEEGGYIPMLKLEQKIISIYVAAQTLGLDAT